MTTEPIATRVCRGKCGLELPLAAENFKRRVRNNRVQFEYYCKSCEKIIKHDIYILYQDKAKDIARKRYIEQKDEIYKKQKVYRANNRHVCNKANQKYTKKTVDNLTDMYIIRHLTLITGVDNNTIKQYPEIIEAKRQQIILRRECQKQRN